MKYVEEIEAQYEKREEPRKLVLICELSGIMGEMVTLSTTTELSNNTTAL